MVEEESTSLYDGQSKPMIFPFTVRRTAVENGEEVLEKEGISHDDVFDSFRMS